MNATTGEASPLPEGRADGHDAKCEAQFSAWGMTYTPCGCAARSHAAPVVAVPEAGEREEKP